MSYYSALFVSISKFRQSALNSPTKKKKKENKCNNNLHPGEETLCRIKGIMYFFWAKCFVVTTKSLTLWSMCFVRLSRNRWQEVTLAWLGLVRYVIKMCEYMCVWWWKLKGWMLAIFNKIYVLDIKKNQNDNCWCFGGDRNMLQK